MKENNQNARKDDILWWMKKGKNSICIQFMNNMQIV